MYKENFQFIPLLHLFYTPLSTALSTTDNPQPTAHYYRPVKTRNINSHNHTLHTRNRWRAKYKRDVKGVKSRSSFVDFAFTEYQQRSHSP